MVSNKTLAVLVLTAVVISLGGTLLSLNKLDAMRAMPYEVSKVIGRATSTGEVNLSIQSNTSCAVITNVTFGGGPKPTSQYNLSSDADNSAAGFGNCTDANGTYCNGLTIDNNGNTVLNVTYVSNKAATAFLGSQTNLDATDFFYYIRNGTATNATQGCTNFTGATTSGNVGTTATLICNKLDYAGGLKYVTMEFNITIENDISPGEKEAVITITCEDNP